MGGPFMSLGLYIVSTTVKNRQYIEPSTQNTNKIRYCQFFCKEGLLWHSGIDSRTIWFHQRKLCRPGRNKTLGYTKVKSCETNVHWDLLWSAGFHEHQCNCAVTLMCVYSFSTEMNMSGGEKVKNALVKIFIRSHAELFLTSHA